MMEMDLAAEADFSWLSLVASMLFAVGAGSFLVALANLAGLVFQTRPPEDESKLSWSERFGRQDVRTHHMWVAPEYAKQRRTIGWCLAVAVSSMALAGFIAPHGISPRLP